MAFIFSNFKAFIAITLASAFISISGNFNFASAQQKYSIDPDAYSVINNAQNNIQLPVLLNFPKSTFVFTPGDNILADTLTLAANPGPANNGGSPAWAMFLNLIAGPNNVIVTQMSTANTGAANASFTVEIFTRVGNALGGPVGSGPGSSTAGWTSLGTVPAVQGTTASGISLIFSIPPIMVPANDTVGVAIRFNTVGPRYFGTGSPPLEVYTDANLKLITGDGRSAPFTPTGSFFSSRALTGVVRYVVDSLTGVSKKSTEIPDGYSLTQNYPNPFNPSTSIEFSIPDRSNLTLKVFDANGKDVITLANGEYAAGTYNVHWNAAAFASGVYFYKIQAGNFNETKKMMLIK